MVPLATALRAEGHEVLVAAPGNFHDTVADAGLIHVTTAEHVDMREKIGLDRAGERVPDPADVDGKLARSGRGFGRAGLASLQATGELLDELQPSLVILEPTEYAARIAAARREIPFVVHDWGFPVPPAMARAEHEELAAEQAELDPAGRSAAPDLTLRTAPGAVLPPGDTGILMRFVPYNGAATVPKWLFQRATRPRVCLTFGTMIGSYPGIDRAIGALASMLASQGNEVLLAVSPQVAKLLPDLPDEVRHIGYIPLNVVLPACDLLVHHGGSGSAMTALATGTPQVVMPHAADQFSNAAHVNSLGAGIGLQQGAVGPDEVHEACARVLSEPAYADRAGKIAAELASRPTPAAIVPRLEALASIRVTGLRRTPGATKPLGLQTTRPRASATSHAVSWSRRRRQSCCSGTSRAPGRRFLRR
jgi:L-demethylnoviosyl transferase